MKIWLPVALVATSFCGPVLANADPVHDPAQQQDSVTQQRMQEIRAQLRQLEQELNAMQREARQGQRVQLRGVQGQDRFPRVDRQRVALRGAAPAPQRQRNGALFGGAAPQVHVEVERLHDGHGQQPRVRVQRVEQQPRIRVQRGDSTDEARAFFLGGHGAEHDGNHDSDGPHMIWQSGAPHEQAKGAAPKVEVHTEAFFIGADGKQVDLGSGGGLFEMTPHASGSPMKSCDCSCECCDSGGAHGGMSFESMDWGVDAGFGTSFGTFSEHDFEGAAGNTFVFTRPLAPSTFGHMVEEENVEECEVEEVHEDGFTWTTETVELQAACEGDCEGDCGACAEATCETEEVVVEYAFAADAIEAAGVYEFEGIDLELEALLHELEGGDHEFEVIVTEAGDGLDEELELLIAELEGSVNGEVERIVVKGVGKLDTGVAHDSQIEAEIEALIAALEGSSERQPANLQAKVVHLEPATGKQDELDAQIDAEIEALIAALEGSAPATSKGKQAQPKTDELAKEIESILVELEAPAAPKAAPKPAPAPNASADKERIAELEGEVEELRSLVDSLIKELNRQ